MTVNIDGSDYSYKSGAWITSSGLGVSDTIRERLDGIAEASGIDLAGLPNSNNTVSSLEESTSFSKEKKKAKTTPKKRASKIKIFDN